MGHLRQILKSTMNGLLPRSLYLTQGQQLRAGSAPGNSRGPAVSLTFDDGPHPEHTPALLDELEAAGIEATFFIVGERAEQHRDIVRRIAAGGHEIANHTWTHSEPRRTPASRFLSELRRTRDFLEDLTGQPCRLVRPPKGELSPGKLIGLLCTRQPVVLWNRDTRDYAMSNPAEIGRWVADYSPQHGDIVLMHDNHPHAASAVSLVRRLHAFSPVRFRRVSDWLPGAGEPFMNDSLPEPQSKNRQRPLASGIGQG